MSTRAATAARPRNRGQGGGRPTRRRRRLLRRRLLFLAVAAAAAVVAAAAMAPLLDRAVQEISLPLRHQDVIVQESREKDLDPSLVAAVIYVESRFRDQTSQAGAKGLMQLMPDTADYIARKSGGTRFEQGDLARPDINIAYGTWYLRYLLDKYGGNEALTLAAYNAGEGKVDGWWVQARRQGEDFDASRHVPFPETREYVAKVLDAREGYEREYERELRL